MKLLSVAIPCYNSENYMRHAVETLLVGGEDVEIIIVDDGSSDKTVDSCTLDGCVEDCSDSSDDG